jgi:hypothetical protein
VARNATARLDVRPLGRFEPRLRDFAPPLHVAPFTLSFLSAKAAARNSSSEAGLCARPSAPRATRAAAHRRGIRASSGRSARGSTLRPISKCILANQPPRRRVEWNGALNGTLFHQFSGDCICAQQMTRGRRRVASRSSAARNAAPARSFLSYADAHRRHGARTVTRGTS